MQRGIFPVQPYAGYPANISVLRRLVDEYESIFIYQYMMTLIPFGNVTLFLCDISMILALSCGHKSAYFHFWCPISILEIQASLRYWLRDYSKPRATLHWRHNDHDGVSNHQSHGCLLNRLFRRRSKKTSKLRVTGLCVGNSPGTGEFHVQMASNAENVSIWWRHHEINLDNPVGEP